jgi:hypothetical protein
VDLAIANGNTIELEGIRSLVSVARGGSSSLGSGHTSAEEEWRLCAFFRTGLEGQVACVYFLGVFYVRTRFFLLLWEEWTWCLFSSPDFFQVAAAGRLTLLFPVLS